MGALFRYARVRWRGQLGTFLSEVHDVYTTLSGTTHDVKYYLVKLDDENTIIAAKPEELEYL